jgi:hypothetical protein
MIEHFRFLLPKNDPNYAPSGAQLRKKQRLEKEIQLQQLSEGERKIRGILASMITLFNQLRQEIDEQREKLRKENAKKAKLQRQSVDILELITGKLYSLIELTIA